MRNSRQLKIPFCPNSKVLKRRIFFCFFLLSNYSTIRKIQLHWTISWEWCKQGWGDEIFGSFSWELVYLLLFRIHTFRYPNNILYAFASIKNTILALAEGRNARVRAFANWRCDCITLHVAQSPPSLWPCIPRSPTTTEKVDYLTEERRGRERNHSPWSGVQGASFPHCIRGEDALPHGTAQIRDWAMMSSCNTIGEQIKLILSQSCTYEENPTFEVPR